MPPPAPPSPPFSLADEQPCDEKFLVRMWARRKNSCRQLQRGPACPAAASPTSLCVCVCDTEGCTSVLCRLTWLGSGIPQTTADLLTSAVCLLPAVRTCLCLGLGLSQSRRVVLSLAHPGHGRVVGKQRLADVGSHAHTHTNSYQNTCCWTLWTLSVGSDLGETRQSRISVRGLMWGGLI